MKIRLEEQEETTKAADGGDSAENAGTGGRPADGGAESEEDTGSSAEGAAGGLDDLIDEHEKRNPGEIDPGEEDEEDEEEEDPVKKKKDEESFDLITNLFIGGFLLRIINRLLTGFNVALFNAMMKKKGKQVSAEKVMLTDDELKPLNILVDRYGADLIKKYLPPWAQVAIYIQGTYIDKMFNTMEPIGKAKEPGVHKEA